VADRNGKRTGSVGLASAWVPKLAFCLQPDDLLGAHRVPEERARHLAASADAADADVAAALDGAVRIALKRGAPQAAAELAEHAVRLTPSEDVDAAHKRRLAAGDAHFEAGDTSRAHAVFAAAADDAVGPARARPPSVGWRASTYSKATAPRP